MQTLCYKYRSGSQERDQVQESCSWKLIALDGTVLEILKLMLSPREKRKKKQRIKDKISGSVKV